MTNKKKPPAAGMGRKKGVPNKTTAILKEAVLIAAANVGNKTGGNGLISYLERRAVDSPVAFMALLGKILPTQTQITGNDGGPVITRIELVAAHDHSKD